MTKSTMTDAELKSLMGKIGDWVSESNSRTQGLRKGGKVKLPKRPTRMVGKKVVPTSLDWGKGIKKDKLAYINADEAAMLKKRRGDTPVRKVKGIPAYAEETVGPGGGSSKGGSGSGGSSGSSSGASSGTGGGGSSAPSNSGSSPSTDEKKSTGPSAGPTDAPARTEASAPAKPAPEGNTFGPRSGNAPAAAKDPTRSADAQAAKVATDVAMSNVAKGSITGSAPKSITDRVPQSAQGVDSGSSLNNKAASSLGKEDITSGAPSPMADGQSYDRNSYDKANADAAKAAAMASSGLLGPSVPAGTAGFNKEQQEARYAGQSPMDKALDVAKAATSPPATSSTVAMNNSINPQTGLPFGEKIQDRLAGAGKQFTDRAPGAMAEAAANPSFTAPAATPTPQAPGRATSIGVKADAAKYSPGDYAGYRSAQENEALARDAISSLNSPTSAAPAAAVGENIVTPAGTITPGQLAQMAPEDQQRIKDWAAANPPGRTRGLAAATTMPSGMHQAAIGQGLAPSVQPSTQPYGGPMAAVDAAHAPTVSGVAPASTVTAATDPTKPYVNNNSPVEQMEPSSPFASKVQGKFAAVDRAVTPAFNAVDSFLSNMLGKATPDGAYARQMANGADGSNGQVNPPRDGRTSNNYMSMKGGKKDDTPGLPPLPPYVNYQHIPGDGTTTPGLVLPPASQPILDFINGGYADGGRVQPQFNGNFGQGFKGVGGAGPVVQHSAAPQIAPMSAQQPTSQPPAQPNSNPWGLEGLDDGTKKGGGGGGGRNSLSLPSKAQFQASFDSWMHDRLGQGGFQGVFGIPEVFGNGKGNGNGGGGNNPKPPPPTDDPPLDPPAPKYGFGWSADRPGWRRGGSTNDRVSAALRLAREL